MWSCYDLWPSRKHGNGNRGFLHIQYKIYGKIEEEEEDWEEIRERVKEWIQEVAAKLGVKFTRQPLSPAPHATIVAHEKYGILTLKSALRISSFYTYFFFIIN